MKPTVSACIISYNQSEFIAQTLDAALAQKLKVDYEIVVGDDASTDGTKAIISERANSDYRIRQLDGSVNLGMHKNWERTILACKGDYIAICEGDDFWDNSEKLKKQVEILEQNPDASACFSNAQVIDQNGVVSEYSYVDQVFSKLSANDFFQLNFNPIPTCTVVFRKSMFSGFPVEYFSSPFADWILHTVLIQNGPFIYLPEITSAYRKHAGGVWSGLMEERQLQNKLKAIKIIRTIVRPEFHDSVDNALRLQLDKLLYFYREEKAAFKYLKTWVRLKSV